MKMDGIAASVKKGDDCLRFNVDDKKSKTPWATARACFGLFGFCIGSDHE